MKIGKCVAPAWSPEDFAAFLHHLAAVVADVLMPEKEVRAAHARVLFFRLSVKATFGNFKLFQFFKIYILRIRHRRRQNSKILMRIFLERCEAIFQNW